jgi:hypothetical protein
MKEEDIKTEKAPLLWPWCACVQVNSSRGGVTSSNQMLSSLKRRPHFETHIGKNKKGPETKIDCAGEGSTSLSD